MCLRGLFSDETDSGLSQSFIFGPASFCVAAIFASVFMHCAHTLGRTFHAPPPSPPPDLITHIFKKLFYIISFVMPCRALCYTGRVFVPRGPGRSHLSHFAILGRGSQTPVQCSVKPERADLKRVFKHQAYSTLQARGGAPLFAIVTGTALVLLKARVCWPARREWF